MAAPLPSFSVVIPLYNKRDFIERTIASVLGQTWSPLELIVVDDGSTDGSGERVAANPDPRIRLIRQANAGEGAARNSGAAAANGEWIALIDADDVWRREHLATLAEVIGACPQADLVGAASLASDLAALDRVAASPSRAGHAELLDFFRQHDGSVFNASSVAIRRSAFAATTGFGRWPVGADTEFWVRFALDHAIAVSSRQTSIYLRGNGGAMERAASDAAGTRDVPQSHAPVFAVLEQALAAPQYRKLHDAIRGYADRTRLNYARGQLYAGRSREARSILKGAYRSIGLPGLVYHLLSYLPGRVLRGGARGYSAVKRRL
ncbi:glycosyltransferase family 2 protein [Sphingomonas sp. 37zxx]|uniref:glycosyltransferase family 2 protein n=1 Tax=Sphingomonas sp. 37zxx TaxID=1550073 RepID=UPI000B29A991|nr:glycosyltransferase family A protein [Sphingomonas sp. 37zxx]